MIWEDQFLENRLTFQPLGEKISLKEPNKTSHKKKEKKFCQALAIYLRLRQVGPTVPGGHWQLLGEMQRPPFKHGCSQMAASEETKIKSRYFLPFLYT